MTQINTADVTNITEEEQTKRLADYIEETALTPLPLPPEFYYVSLPLCVIDAVFSIGVKYTSTWNTVTRFCKREDWVVSLDADVERTIGEYSISKFLTLFDELSPEQMADNLFGNRQRTSFRSGILKAEAVHRFSSALKQTGIDDFGNLGGDSLTTAETRVREIPGQASGISFDYFRMLAGNDNLIKPDRMVQRYIAKALGEKPQQVTPGKARSLLQGAVKNLAVRGVAPSLSRRG